MPSTPTISKAILAKDVTGTLNYIYPKTSADIVKYGSDSTVEDEIQTLIAAKMDIDDYDATKTQHLLNVANTAKNTSDLQDIHTYITRDTSDYGAMQRLVYAGFAEDAYPLGKTIAVTHSVFGELIFEPVAYDYLFKETSPGNHSMTIMMRTATTIALQFNAPEILYKPASSMAPGTYSFTIPDYDSAHGGNATYKFTTTVTVPAGGCVCFTWPKDTAVTNSASFIQTFSTQTSTTQLEKVYLTAGTSADGTYLGTADGSGDLNHIHRVRYGSNNYAQSAIDQLLNSSAAAGSVWSPAHDFDRPPAWVSNRAGFIAGLPTKFKDIIETVSIKCKTNSVFETSPYTIDDNYNISRKFYLASIAELYGANIDAVQGVDPDGTILDTYEDSASVFKTKFDINGTARAYWLRSPVPNSASSVRYCKTNGSYDTAEPNGSNYLVVLATVCG